MVLLTRVWVRITQEEGEVINMTDNLQQWPASITEDVQINGFSQKARENTIRSSVEAGVDKIRRRYTTPIVEIKFNRWFTFEQYETIENFYNITTAGGVFPFTFPDPATNEVYVYRFLTSPSYSALGGLHYQVSFSFERLYKYVA